MSAEAAAIEVDDEHVLDDYASSYDSDWTSAAGSSYDYTYENGRRYHAVCFLIELLQTIAN